jgi:hypothetical protein
MGLFVMSARPLGKTSDERVEGYEAKGTCLRTKVPRNMSMGWREGTEGNGDAVCEMTVGKQLHCFKPRLNPGFLERRGWSF